MEATLKELWAEILDQDVSVVDDDSNFFELGGDSVGAIRLIEAAREKNIDIEQEDVFEIETFGEMLHICEKKGMIKQNGKVNGEVKGDAPHDEAVQVSDEVVVAALSSCKIERDELQDIKACVEFVDYLYKFHLAEGKYLFQVTLELKGVDLDRLRKAWNAVHEKHAALRSRIIIHDSRSYMVTVTGQAYWQETTMNIKDFEPEDLATRMEAGMPLSRSTIVRNGDHTYLVWSIHHAIKDGWSKKLAMEYLQEAYSDPDAYAQKANPAPYSNFVKWYMTSPMEDAMTFWRKQLKGVKKWDYLSHGNDKKPTTENRRISVHRFQLPQQPRTQITLSTMSYVATAIILGNMSGADDVYFSAVRSGRQIPVPGIQHMIGPLISMIPFRVRLDASQSLKSLLRKSQDTVIAGSQYEPFGNAVEYENAKAQGWPAEWRQLRISAQPIDVQSFDKDIPLKSNDDGSQALLRPGRSGFSKPWGFGLFLEIFPQIGQEIMLKATYDIEYLPGDSCQKLFEEFADIFKVLYSPGDKTVEDVWTGKK